MSARELSELLDAGRAWAADDPKPKSDPPKPPSETAKPANANPPPSPAR